MGAPGPLLVIAAGGNARARRERIPVPRESPLHRDVAALLTQCGSPDWLWRHINATARDAREGAIMKRMGVRAGWPDFILVDPCGRVHFLELKRPGGALSDLQERFRDHCLARGIPWAMAWQLKQAIDIFSEWGCLRI